MMPRPMNPRSAIVAPPTRPPWPAGAGAE
jgi:hypothetical protein